MFQPSTVFLRRQATGLWFRTKKLQDYGLAGDFVIALFINLKLSLLQRLFCHRKAFQSVSVEVKLHAEPYYFQFSASEAIRSQYKSHAESRERTGKKMGACKSSMSTLHMHALTHTSCACALVFLS